MIQFGDPHKDATVICPECCTASTPVVFCCINPSDGLPLGIFNDLCSNIRRATRIRRATGIRVSVSARKASMAKRSIADGHPFTISMQLELPLDDNNTATEATPRTRDASGADFTRHTHRSLLSGISVASGTVDNCQYEVVPTKCELNITATALATPRHKRTGEQWRLVAQWYSSARCNE